MTVDGTYSVTVKTPLGSQKGSLTIETEGASFRGTLTSAHGTAAFSGGSIRGNELVWEADTHTPMGVVSVAYEATLLEGRLTGKANTPFGSTAFEGTKI